MANEDQLTTHAEDQWASEDQLTTHAGDQWANEDQLTTHEEDQWASDQGEFQLFKRTLGQLNEGNWAQRP